MANWTIAFADRTDGAIMLSDINLAMKPITSTGASFSTAFTQLFACYTSDSEFTVNGNTFTVQNDDSGTITAGGATITLLSWTPNSKQMDTISKIPELKKYRYFFKIKLSDYTANHVIVTFNPDITVEQPTPPTPPQPVEKKYNLLDSVPAGYDVKGGYHYDGNNNLVFDDIDVSQLKYNKGDTLPDFCLTIKDGYEYDADYWSEKWDTDVYPYIASSDKSSYYNSGLPHQERVNTPALWISFRGGTKQLPDELVTFGSIPHPTVVVPHYTVQLNLLNCTADKPTVSKVNEGDSYTVNFTADNGYVFNEQPYVQVGSETIYADIIDSTHARLTLSSVNENLTITAHATESVEPVEPTSELAFVNVYNPTQKELVDAANALFMNFSTGQVIDTSKYIIAVHKVFVPVSTDANPQSIKFGYYDSQVNSKVVNQRLARVSCGKVTVPELHHNALDYSPYTTVRIWLPFLGFSDLSIDELSNKEVELTYTIDLVNGKALAEISNDDGVIYRFVGTAYEREPYHTESLNNVSTVYINGAYNMADYTPYLLIERPINLTPPNNDLEGLPTYKEVTIGDMTGYVRCRKVFAKDMIATEAEKNEIEALLCGGVLVD
jgi:hypothetical protein